jgi:hypothetical protein
VQNCTTGELLNCINNFVKEYKINGEKFVHVCSDCDRAVFRKVARTVIWIESVTMNCISSYCFLHRQAFAIKEMSVSLKNILEEVVQIFNYIKLDHCNVDYSKKWVVNTVLLLHTEMRWLSGKKVLKAF